jgi:hypothetical protein
VAAEFRVDDVVGEEPPPSWNVAPTQDARVVLERVARGTISGHPQRKIIEALSTPGSDSTSSRAATRPTHYESTSGIGATCS